MSAREYAFELFDGPRGSRFARADSLRGVNQPLIREHIASLQSRCG